MSPHIRLTLAPARDGDRPRPAVLDMAAGRGSVAASNWVDRLGCFAVLLLTLPLLILAAYAVLATSAGPLLSRVTIIDSNGRAVVLRQFRTTYCSAAGHGSLGARPGMTPTGRFLHRTGIKRLPRLADVWAGKIGLAAAIVS